MKIYEKLAFIQKELKAPKNQYNAFGKYKYRNAEDILEAVKPLLDGLVLTISDDIISIGDRFYIKATATITDGENAISTTAFAREEDTKKGMDASQISGASSSYARKYALNGLFLIDDTKDSDSLNDNIPKIENIQQPVPVEKKNKPAYIKVAEEYFKSKVEKGEILPMQIKKIREEKFNKSLSVMTEEEIEKLIQLVDEKIGGFSE